MQNALYLLCSWLKGPIVSVFGFPKNIELRNGFVQWNDKINSKIRRCLLKPSIWCISHIYSYKSFQSWRILGAPWQRNLAVNSVLSALDDKTLKLEVASGCSFHHDPPNIIKMAVYTCTTQQLLFYEKRCSWCSKIS